jgi:polyhydroxyalkanoate synthesis regulator protein
MQIITELETEGHESLLTNRVLEELIRFFGDKAVAAISPHLEQMVLQSLEVQDQLRKQLTSALVQPYPTPEETFKYIADQYQELTGSLSPFAPAPVDKPDKDS